MSSLLASRGVLFTAWGVVVLVLAGGLTLAYVQPPPAPGAEAVTVAMLSAPPAPLDTPDAQSAPAAPGSTETGVSPEAEGPEPEAAKSRETDSPPAAVTTTLPPPKPQAPPQTPAEEERAVVEVPISQEPTAAEAAASDAGGEQIVAIPLVPPAPEELPYWERYRQPFNMEDPRPRIAVVLTGLGLSDSATEAAITKLPPAVTLSFSPYARNLESWIALARSRGHEVMLDLPMEPATFPNEDPGPHGLLTSLSAEDNLDRLDWVLSRGSAYVGLAGSMGSRFTASRQDIEPILRNVKERGLIFLDRRSTESSVVADLAAEIELPAAINNRSVDERQASRVAIDARLAQIERIALTNGFAVAMAQPYPVTLDRLAEWATELTARGFAIAPISALADRHRQP